MSGKIGLKSSGLGYRISQEVELLLLLFFDSACFACIHVARMSVDMNVRLHVYL